MTMIITIGVAAEDYVRLVGLVVVALHGGGAGDPQLAALADGQLFVRTRLEGGRGFGGGGGFSGGSFGGGMGGGGGAGSRF